jgi:hypothetical protein
VWFLSESVVYVIICLYFDAVSKDWIYVQIPNIALTVLGICALFTMPETPRFFLAQGKVEEAKQVFAKIAKFNGISEDEVQSMELMVPNEIGSKKTQSYANTEEEVLANSSNSKCSLIKELVQDQILKRNLIGCCIIWSMVSYSFYVITFTMKYFPGDLVQNSLTFAFSDVIAFAMSGWVIKKVSVVRGYQVAFLVATISGVLYVLFSTVVPT